MTPIPEAPPMIQEMSAAVYEKIRVLPDGTEEVVKGYHKILVKAVIGKEGPPVFKVPPVQMPQKATPEGAVEHSIVKAAPTVKAPLPKAVPMPKVWASSPPQKKNGLS